MTQDGQCAHAVGRRMMSCTAQDARGAAEPLVIDEATAIGEVQYAGADGAAIWLTNEARAGSQESGYAST
ncbi:hypothetical protein [Ralstonia pseudosolanacearum]|uniref:hypothetical protein n=2 Tax=Ralstonia pseudosolanacearum TaxID=1310165 RepID=UPI000316E794|nr:hypothetical protein [Ralstonia pseudosolanacearum]MCK4140461.1 hypothetical protein [Ralstonia pseudosolanacearum]TXD92326.1 hypothetical protein FUT89_10205 [Ralstonia pseudosolanacearum]